MISNCLKCRKNAESKNLKAVKTKNNEQWRIMLLSKFEVWDSKKSNFIREQETRGLFNLGILFKDSFK